MDYDVIIAGASFCGLAVAANLKGNILLIDRKPIGAVPTSACTSPLYALETEGLQDSIIELVDKVKFITAYNEVDFRSIVPFAVFDYKIFCQKYFERFEGDFKKEQIIEFDGQQVVTTKGRYSAKVFIDCTGWRATLASALQPGFVKRDRLGFGLETELAYKTESLQFIFNPKVINAGYAWIFPAGPKARIGMGSFVSSKNLVPKLDHFVESLGLKTASIHGGFMPYRLRTPTVRNLFLVGDSAGQILPLTGEGIRQGMYFAKECARIVQNIIEDEKSLDEGLAEYHRIVENHRNFYGIFQFLQQLWSDGPNLLVGATAWVGIRRPVCMWAQKNYFETMKV